jgi:competence ComEA-like helix-hairpin-helix protein
VEVGVWSRSQRAALGGIVIVLAIIFLVRYWGNPVYISDPLLERGSHASELADRIDPNSADATTLSALPTVGPKRAAMIVKYREEFIKDGRGNVPFKKLEDLLKIKGIGIASIEILAPHLCFPAEGTSTTKP